MKEPKRKTVLITGGTSGIGLGLVLRYHAEGYRVATCSFESEDIARKKLPIEVDYFEADVTQTRRMREVIREFTEKSGRLDLVIANAGINHPKSKIPDFEHGTKVIDVNINGVLNTFGPAIEIMRKQGFGHLVSMSSIAGIIGGLPGMSIYCASKAAVFSLCESLAIDLKKYGITVTTFAPGFVDTPLTKANTHAMPFRMSAEEAVDRIFLSIAKKKELDLFPLPLRLLAIIMRCMPRTIYRRLLRQDFLGTAR